MARVGVIVFPGSNCDHDAYHALKHVMNAEVKFLWHKETDVSGLDMIIVPGGFSYGDYLRSGAIARFSPIMQELIGYAHKGGPVMGICNGFQILCESGLLPGALIRNDCLDFRCLNQSLFVENSNDRFNQTTLGKSLLLPIAHGEGNYRADESVLSSLEANDQILLRYSGNPNGSMNDIAGIRNSTGNVYGMMPHPERAVGSHHPCLDGLPVLKAFLEPVLQSRPAEVSS